MLFQMHIYLPQIENIAGINLTDKDDQAVEVSNLTNTFFANFFASFAKMFLLTGVSPMKEHRN